MTGSGPPPRLVTVVVDRPRRVLPPVEVASPWWMEAGPVVDAVLDRFGLDVVVLRLLEGGTFPGGPVTYLVELDGTTAPGDDLGTAELPDRLAGALAPDPLRAPWAETGGVAELTRWLDDELAGRGERRTGGVRQVRSWNLSCLLRVDTTAGPRWAKAVPSFFAHEPAVIAAVGDADPSLPPPLLAGAEGRSLLGHVDGVDGYDADGATILDVVHRFVDVVDRLSPTDLRAIGVPEFTVDDLRMGIVEILERHDAAVDADLRSRAGRLLDEFDDRVRAAEATARLVHGDIHGGNLRLSDAHPPVLIDWGDALVAHPLFDLASVDNYFGGLPADDAARIEGEWLGRLDLTAGAWAAFRPLAASRLAVLYQRFCDGIAASERVYHRHDIVPALRRATDLLD